jgi:adhesin transport system outer membrane protein
LAQAAETLQQAVAAAMRRFPEIQAAQHRQEAARAQVGQARAELLPAVSGTLGAGRERSRNASTQVLGEQATLSRTEAELTLSQLLFDGGAATGQLRRFSARAQGAEFNVVGTMQDVALRAGQAFVDVQRLREQLGIARENIRTHEKTLADVTLLADSGRGRRADVTQAEARRALAASSADQLAGQLAQAEDSFRHFMGRPPGALAAPPTFQTELPPRVDDAIGQAIAMHPVVKAAEKELDAAQHDRASARARLVIPRVTVEAGLTRNRDVSGIPGQSNDQFAMLRLRYNLFRGFGESERVRETEARIDEAIAELARIRGEVERDIRQAWDALGSDRIRLPQLAQYARASADVAEAYRLQFQLGQRSLLDVLNAENERYNAVSSYIAGRAVIATDELRLLASQGRLIEALGLSVPGAGSRGDGPVGATGGSRGLACAVAAVREDSCLVLRLETALPDRYGLDQPLSAGAR